MVPPVIRPLTILFLAALLAGGCGQDAIKVYTIPKEATPVVAEEEHKHEAPLTWTTPAGWQELPPGEMRVGSFKAGDADVSIIPLGGTAGGDTSNVNRWRGQVGLPAASEEEIKKAAEPVEVAGQKVSLYTLAGGANSILAAMLQRDGTTWFFKMTGPSGTVAQQKPSFVTFLKSVQFGGAKQQPPPAADTTPWKLPADWKQVPAGEFLLAKFLIGDGKASVNVSSSAGDGGGVAANVNRWRKQLGLPDLTGAEMAKTIRPLPTTTGQAVLVEMTGKDAKSEQPVALVGAIVVLPGKAMFYKLMGEPDVVTAQKETFIKFVQEAKH
jgi:hypothetical protein